MSADEPIVRKGLRDGKRVRILIDSGATSNLIRPGLSFKIEKTISATAKRFDGTETETKIVQLVRLTLEVDGQILHSEPMLETHQVTFAESPECQEVKGDELRQKLRQPKYAEVFHVKVRMENDTEEKGKENEAMPEIKELLEEFQDVFPEHLPDRLPPKRKVEIEIKLKPGA
ncbi:hypothetical protein Plhal703r1_c36g0131381 [Plasmopara halstedii]